MQRSIRKKWILNTQETHQMDEIIKTTNIRTALKNKLIQVGPNSEGKIPPQVLELEESVLGSIMLDRSAMDTAYNIVSERSFYKNSHGTIYQAMLRLFVKREPIDLLTVTQELREMGELDSVGGAYYITILTTRMTSAANIEYHARIVQEMFLKREVIRISNEAIRNAYEDTSDVFELIDVLDTGIFELTKNTSNKEPVKIDTLYSQVINNADRKDKTKQNGILCGYKAIDSIIKGFEYGTTVTVGARPSMGKTAFMVNLAYNFATIQNIPTAVFSLESPALAITTRYASIHTGIPATFLKNGEVYGKYYESLIGGIGKISNTPLYIDDQQALTLIQFRSKVRRLVALGVRIVLADYLLLFAAEYRKGQSRENEVSGLSRGMMSIAKEFNVLLFDLTQLSRQCEMRPNKRPILSDLRESGSIEQDSNIVMFLYRDEYYYQDKSEFAPGTTEIIIAKNRDGDIGTAQLMYTKELTKFTDFSQYETADYSTYGENINNKQLGETGDPF